MATYRTVCKIGACEKFCGIEVDVEDGRMERVRFDKSYPITRGVGCIKGVHVADYQNDPDRLIYPERKTAAGWERVDWKSATRDVRALDDFTGMPVYNGTPCRVVRADAKGTS